MTTNIFGENKHFWASYTEVMVIHKYRNNLSKLYHPELTRIFSEKFIKIGSKLHLLRDPVCFNEKVQIHFGSKLVKISENKG